MNLSKSQKTQRLVIGGVMVALATVLSFIKVFELPYGGSITLCSMLPIIFFAYMYGVKWGLFSGVVYGVIQLLFGTSALRGLSLGAVFGSIVFDFLIAFAMLGLAGIFRNKIKNDALAVTFGAILAIILRFVSHVISGAIFFGDYADWYFSQAGFELGEKILSNYSGNMLVIVYSTIYNGMYMLPEMIITAIVAFFVMQVAGKQLLNQDSLG